MKTFIVIIVLFVSVAAIAETPPEMTKHQKFIESLKKTDIAACIKPGANCEQRIVNEIKEIYGKYSAMALNHIKELVENVFKAAKRK